MVDPNPLGLLPYKKSPLLIRQEKHTKVQPHEAQGEDGWLKTLERDLRRNRP